MNTLALLWREARNELGFGLRSGVVALVFIGLTLYLLMVLTNAGYLQDMGAVDVPRNAPNLVYLMTAGDAFFLFFAWAWVFSQPIVRDRQAQLHEIVLTAPLSLQTLLWGRFLGALGVALLLGASQIAGFLLAPMLETFGLVPAGSMGATPWRALAWSMLIFTLPTALGAGALYFVAALKTRSAAGPFGVSALLILVWMFAMIVMSEGGIHTQLAAVLDPSGFADVDRMNKGWTPSEKASVIYPLTEPFLLNRLFWCLAPLALLVFVVARCTREKLVLERPARARLYGMGAARRVTPLPDSGPLPLPEYRWRAALLAEWAWQLRQLWRGRMFPLLFGGMVILGIAAIFVHGINHADGPFEARPEITAPLLAETLYLVLAFVLAALIGHLLRRDDRAGFAEMIDAAPAPAALRLLGAALSTLVLTMVLCLAPALSVILVAAFAAPHAFSISTPLMIQLGVFAPALLEVAAVTLLMHALIRPAGPAYAASMLAAFILVVNHEAKLVTYPPLEVGIPAHISFSVLTGWGQWAERLLAGNLYKLALCSLLVALAALLLPRGQDSRLAGGARQLRTRLLGPSGAIAVLALGSMLLLYPLLESQFVAQGGYLSRQAQLDRNAAWERHGLAQAGDFSLSGGSLDLRVNTAARAVQGEWRLDSLMAANGRLYLELPEWVRIEGLRVEGRELGVPPTQDYAIVELGQCPPSGCSLTIAFQSAPRGWRAEGDQPWLTEAGIWATASQILPRLGSDSGRLVRAPRERALLGLPLALPPLRQEASAPVLGVAPAGDWQLHIRVDTETTLRQSVRGLLDFALIAPAPSAALLRTRLGGIEVLHDNTRIRQAQQVAEDVTLMRSCIARRLGAAPEIDSIAQLPRGMGSSAIASGALLLAEEPHWDVRGTGVGRWRRQAEIGALLAERAIADSVDLRQGEGAVWLTSGLSGALGYLCVGDHQGVSALQALLARGAEGTAHALAAARAPVGPILEDTADAWLRQYTPLATLAWAATQSPQALQSLLHEIRQQRQVAGPLQRLAGSEIAAALLGVPRASDVALLDSESVPRAQISRRVWRNGGWQDTTAHAPLFELRMLDSILHSKMVSEALEELTPGTLLLDGWLGYERSPEDNLVP